MGRAAERQAARGPEGAAALRGAPRPGPEGALEALDLARWDELPEAELPWDEVEAAARRQGISEADVIWDLAGKRPMRRGSRRRSVVRVEAGAALAAELPFADHLDQQLRGLRGRPRRSRRRGRRRSPRQTSRPTKSSSASGPIGWPAPSFMQASTSPASMPVRSMQPDGVEEVGEEQAVDDEAGLVGDLDRGLAERRAPGERPLAGAVGAVGEADLDQLHPRHRVEDVEAEEAAGDAAAPRRSRRSPSEEVVVARSALGAGLGELARAARPSAPPPRRSPRRRRRTRRGRRGRWSPAAARARRPRSWRRRRRLSPRRARRRPRCGRAGSCRAVVVETAARPVAIAPLPAIAGRFVSRARAHRTGFLSRSARDRRRGGAATG